MSSVNLRQLFFQHIAQTSPFPLQLEIEKAEGIYLYDTDGKSYIDAISGINVSSLGHCHPYVVNAVKNQVGQYMHTLVYGEYVLSPQVLLAKALADVLPETLSNVYFLNSGTEATEVAMKLAKRYTGRQEIIACRNAYHGSTQGAASLMDAEWITQSFRPLLPGIKHIDFNKFEDLDSINKHTACVIIEPIQAEAGIIIPLQGYLEAVRCQCIKTGALLIFDEIQTGYGKTGSLFAFQKYNVTPDILLLGKAMGGGMPIAACISSHKIMNSLTHNPILGHITTFGGHPVNCAAGLATLNILLSSGLIQVVESKEKLFRTLLVSPNIKELRITGLMMAIDLGDNQKVQNVIQYCLQNGLITDWFLFNDRSLRICPPLIITEEQIRVVCDILLKAINSD
ncbi:MAG TPA: aspartate aminotransferase family protein [Saprospiraceae bacterium]|nr:aspartate aminotransferase family protein [Saprospiraceae bacterium]